MDSRRFYDEYVGRQLRVGVNERHHAILRWLKQFGLSRGKRVLEIGCGVGALTGLVADAIGPRGSLVAVDLSPGSIRAAEERLGQSDNVQFVEGDILELPLADRFDVVLLPDVIEHIPLTLHHALFSRVAGWVEADGFVLLHYPNPYYQEWCREQRPDLLQLVDQAVHVNVLLANAYPHGLHLTFFQTYPIWTLEGEYQVAVLRPNPSALQFTAVEPRVPVFERARRLARKLLQ
jgi:cyclopropane fatty-acyl-phospholipid synthase-like methyltransferase